MKESAALADAAQTRYYKGPASVSIRNYLHSQMVFLRHRQLIFRLALRLALQLIIQS